MDYSSYEIWILILFYSDIQVFLCAHLWVFDYSWYFEIDEFQNLVWFEIFLVDYLRICQAYNIVFTSFSYYEQGRLSSNLAMVVEWMVFSWHRWSYYFLLDLSYKLWNYLETLFVSCLDQSLKANEDICIRGFHLYYTFVLLLIIDIYFDVTNLVLVF